MIFFSGNCSHTFKTFSSIYLFFNTADTYMYIKFSTAVSEFRTQFLAQCVLVATSPLETEVKGTKGVCTVLKPMTFCKEDWFPTVWAMWVETLSILLFLFCCNLYLLKVLIVHIWKTNIVTKTSGTYTNLASNNMPKNMFHHLNADKILVVNAVRWTFHKNNSKNIDNSELMKN